MNEPRSTSPPEDADEHDEASSPIPNHFLDLLFCISNFRDDWLKDLCCANAARASFVSSLSPGSSSTTQNCGDEFDRVDRATLKKPIENNPNPTMCHKLKFEASCLTIACKFSVALVAPGPTRIGFVPDATAFGRPRSSLVLGASGGLSSLSPNDGSSSLSVNS